MMFLRLLLCPLLALVLSETLLAAPIQRSANGLQPKPPVTAESPTLAWRNGETLPGQLTGGTGAEAYWRSPLFEEPLHLRWSALRRVEQPQTPSATEEPFSIHLRDGFRLYGNPVALDGEVLTLTSQRYGTARIKRSEVLQVRRLRGEALHFAGPSGLAGWTSLPRGEDEPKEKGQGETASNEEIAPLQNGPGGTLELPYWNRAAFRDVDLPPSIDCEFRIRSSERLDFKVALFSGKGGSLSIQTFAEDMVVSTASGFMLIRKLAETERELALRICWDVPQRRCVIYTPAGEKLLEWAVPAEKASKRTGVLLANHGRNLSLQQLQIRSWNGRDPAPFDASKPRVDLAGGLPLVGEVVSLADGQLKMKAEGDTAASDLPWSAVETLVLQATPALPTVKQEATLAFADGTLLGGRIAGMEGEKLLLETSSTAGPLSVDLQGLSRMDLNVPGRPGSADELPVNKLDEFTMGRTVLHGTLADLDAQALRWYPVGASTPVRMKNEGEVQVTRAREGRNISPSETLFYLRQGDVLPGQLRGIGEKEVEIASPLFDATTLPASGLAAIQFSGGVSRNLQGFSDPAWRVVRGDEQGVTRTGDTLRLQGSTAFLHPAAMQGGEVNFTLDNSSYSVLSVQFFAQGKEDAKPVRLLLTLTGDRVIAALETADGFTENQSQIRAAAGPVKVRLAIAEKWVDLFVNDMRLQRYADAAPRVGSGIIFAPGSMWGNRVQPVIVSNFSTKVDPGSTWLPEISEEVKRQVLMVPRFRKQDLPGHLLVAANGDVLRGQIEGTTSTHLGFRSGLETLRVPRERVKAAIWLRKPDAAAAPEEAEKPWVDLLNKPVTQLSRSLASNQGLQVRYIMRMLQRYVPEVKVEFSSTIGEMTMSAPFKGQSVRDLLDEISAALRIHYEVAEDGTVTLKEGYGGSANGAEQRVYWLSRDPFAGQNAVELLKAKGLPWPQEAKLEWHPETRQLAASGPAALHTRLEDWLRSEIGEPPLQPTHFLVLASGAQFPLRVDRTEEGVVQGAHPLYGKCRIPLVDIHAIRRSATNPSIALRMLRNWRLVYAPEPVLPSGEGGSSPLVGKPAPAFKVPMVGGPEFDSKKAAGKVVVLEFWATWCGPCVQSLPSLINALKDFSPEQVSFVGMNQSEPPAQIKPFMEGRGWKFPVALDAGGQVLKQYGGEGIPHTVIIGRDGKVAWVHSGTTAETAAEAQGVVRKLLEEPAGADAAGSSGAPNP